MQYMPISFDTAKADYAYSDYGSNDSSMSNFSSELENACCQTDRQNESVKSENDENEDAEDTSVYSTRAEIYSFFVPQEPRLNSDELSKLAKAFQNDNVCIEAQNALAELINKPGGVSMKELLAQLTKATKGGNADLSTKEIAYLQNLAGRANPNQPSVLYDSLRYQDGFSGMQALISSLKKNPTTLSSEELSALSKALNLPKEVHDGMQQLLGLMDKNKVLSAEEVDAVFKEAKALLESRNENFSAMQKSLEQNVKLLLENAQKREVAERRELMRENRDVLYSKAMIEDSVVTRVMGEQLNRSSAEQTGKNDDVKDRMTKKMSDETIVTKLSEEQQHIFASAKVQNEREANLKAEDKFFESKQEEKVNAKEQHDRFNLAENGRTAHDAKDFDHGSQEREEKKSFAEMGQAERVLAGMAGQQAMQAAAFDVNTAKFAEHTDHLRMQVQDSMLTMMKNGAKRLEVSLNPVELGQMAVVLTMRNGEVNAVIQAEKAESASLINQQVEVIRQELENQGLKVQNIDVEVGFSSLADGNNGQNWDSMQQHNNEQNLRETLQNLNYLRALSRKGNQEDITLAHNMQNIGSIVAGKENNSLQGLHIIT